MQMAILRQQARILLWRRHGWKKQQQCREQEPDYFDAHCVTDEMRTDFLLTWNGSVSPDMHWDFVAGECVTPDLVLEDSDQCRG